MTGFSAIRRSRIARRLTGTCKAGLDATAHPTIRDLAWAAGFLEGEGSFHGHPGIPRGSDRPRRGSASSVRAMQVNREPLDRLRELFGGHVSFRDRVQDRRRDGRKHSGAFTWSVSGARARGVAMTLYPFLSRRRQEQARRVWGIFQLTV